MERSYLRAVDTGGDNEPSSKAASSCGGHTASFFSPPFLFDNLYDLRPVRSEGESRISVSVCVRKDDGPMFRVCIALEIADDEQESRGGEELGHKTNPRL
jgi:hypothetical protein